SYKYDYDISIWKKNKYDDKIISRQNIFKIKINNEIIFIECHGRPIQLCDLQGNYIKNIQYSYVMCFNDTFFGLNTNTRTSHKKCYNNVFIVDVETKEIIPTNVPLDNYYISKYHNSSGFLTRYHNPWNCTYTYNIYQLI